MRRFGLVRAFGKLGEKFSRRESEFGVTIWSVKKDKTDAKSMNGLQRPMGLAA